MSKLQQFVKPFVLKVNLSNKYIYAQVVHRPTGSTLASATSLEKGLKESLRSTSDVIAAAEVGKLVAQRALKEDIVALCFELPLGKKYHGKMKAMIDAVRDAGVKLI